MQPALVWYWLNGKDVLNFGEHFVELILAKMDIQPVYFDAALENKTIKNYETCWLIVGSELHRGLVGRLLQQVETVSVWGQGNGRGKNKALLPDQIQRTRIFALRGPLTLDQLQTNIAVPLCDPGFLMPRLYPMDASRKGKYLYIPHNDNRKFASRRLSKNHADTFVDIFVHKNNIFHFMDNLVKAKFVLTNSLHCFIFCLAYHIPCAVVLHEDETLNMPDKWQDVFFTLNAELKTVSNLEEGQKWWDEVGKNLILPNSQELLRAFPLYANLPLI